MALGVSGLNQPSLISRNVRVNGARTSIRLELLEWQALDQVCSRLGQSVNQFCTAASRERTEKSRTSRIRMSILAHYMDATTRAEQNLRRYGNTANRSSGSVAKEITVDNTTMPATSSTARP